MAPVPKDFFFVIFSVLGELVRAPTGGVVDAPKSRPKFPREKKLKIVGKSTNEVRWSVDEVSGDFG